MTVSQTMIRTKAGTPVWMSGAGPAVILIHGVMVDHRMWARQVEALAPHYRVCCMDMLGHGEAPDPPGERTLDDFVVQAREVIEHFSDAGRPVLGGFSMGGLIAQACAIRHHAELSGLVLMNTVHDRTPEESARVLARFEGNVAHGVENAVESGLRRWFRKHERKPFVDVMRNVEVWMRDGDFTAKRKAHRVFVTSDEELTGKLGAISCPALVMTGEDDAGSTPAMSRKMAAAIPDAECHVLASQHHMMPVLDADRVNGLLLGFLERCSG
ncbi:MAG: alpha/beta fold hydrolase [Hyphomicrobiaceae bacterium]